METKLIQSITIACALFLVFFINQKMVAQCLPAELGSIGNYVWHDANDNGIQDGIESGASGVSIYLIKKEFPDACVGKVIFELSLAGAIPRTLWVGVVH